MQQLLPAEARINTAALAHNFHRARALFEAQSPGGAVIAVVKADAYGHGAAETARRLAAEGCAHFAVYTVAEAAEVQAALPSPAAALLVLGGVHSAAEADAVLALGAVPVVHSTEGAALLSARARACGKPARVQAEIDTGMRRLGFPPHAAAAALAEIARDPWLKLEGVFTHLARADESIAAPTLKQLARFGEVLAQLQACGVAPGMVHAANSAGLLAAAGANSTAAELRAAMPAECNACRPGLMLYGVSPAMHLAAAARLRPALALRARVCGLREVQRGDAAGYGGAWRAPAAGRVAALPLGYADGLPWALGAGGGGGALLRGRRVAIAGRISMDTTLLWCGAGEVALGDGALLFGPGLPAEEVAARAGTIAYELLVRIGRRIPRHYATDAN